MRHFACTLGHFIPLISKPCSDLTLSEWRASALPSLSHSHSLVPSLSRCLTFTHCWVIVTFYPVTLYLLLWFVLFFLPSFRLLTSFPFSSILLSAVLFTLSSLSFPPSSSPRLSSPRRPLLSWLHYLFHSLPIVRLLPPPREPAATRGSSGGAGVVIVRNGSLW